MQKQRIAILGASRGLGRSLAEQLSMAPDVEAMLLVCRSAVDELASLDMCTHFRFDLSSRDQKELYDQLQEFQPTTLIYCAGGGPFAEFTESQWHSHQWALNVTFLSCAQALHWFMNRSEAKSSDQFIAIGSSIAEDKPDAKASSYAAAKHALLGLYQSIQAEKPELDFRLFSPGYMDTSLLPKGSWPRRQSQPLWQPDEVAKILWGWASDPRQFGGHFSLNAFAETPRNTH